MGPLALSGSLSASVVSSLFSDNPMSSCTKPVPCDVHERSAEARFSVFTKEVKRTQ